MGQKKKVDILSPADSAYEAEILIKAGATSLYCGVFPSYFEKYSYFFSPNQRTFREAQIDEKELVRISEICKKNKVALYVTINQNYFLEEQIPLIIRLAKEVDRLDIEGIIMGSIPLMLHIKDAGIKTPIVASTMAVVLNRYSVLFYKEHFNINKITLPRSLTIAEIKNIIKANPNIYFDTFILVGKCPNIEGFCGFLHTNPDKIWPCEQVYEINLSSKKNKRLINAKNVQEKWQGFPRSHGCGICAIPELMDAGIKGLKIVGRGSPVSFKKKNVELVIKALEIFEKTDDLAKSRIEILSLYKEYFKHDCSPFLCYFPEIRAKIFKE
jgi:putative protease